MDKKPRLFLLDAYALIFRGYYAFIRNPQINSKGQNTSAVMGFVNTLFDIIRRERPDHLAVCFDKNGSEERTEMYAEYKANRDKTPQDIIDSIPIIKDILKAMHIPSIVLPGVEADDIIGTLSKKAEKEGYQVFMVTSDKDFGQLVSENIFMYRPARMGNGIEIWGIPEVQERFGVEDPLQVIDYLGMMGDASDNIPGLPGVGKKTAEKFLAQFGSMENLLANTDQLKGKMKERIIENAELGLLSKKLATIVTDYPIEFDAKTFELEMPDAQKVQELFEDLEFRRLRDQFLKLFNTEEATNNNTQPAAKSAQTAKQSAGSGQFSLFDSNEAGSTEAYSSRQSLETKEHFYQLVQPGMGTKLFFEKLLKQKEVSFDIETSSLDTRTTDMLGIAFSWESGKGYYVPVNKELLEQTDFRDNLQAFLADENILKVGQNLKFDIKVLAQYGFTISDKLFDTMLAHYLINPDMRHNLDVLSETYLNYTPQPIEELIGKKGKKQGSMADVPLALQKEYAAEDADLTWQLKEYFQKELTDNNAIKLFEEVEVPLMPVLAAMEIEGINLDTDFLKELAVDIDVDILNLEKQIYELAGEEFNIASPKQLGEIIFGKMELVSKPKKTKTGQFSTGEEILTPLAKEHPIVANILEYRGLAKLKSTYVDALPKQVAEDSKRIHTEYMQTVAATGRLSSTNPNLQNIPVRTERGKLIRKAFIPKNEDYVLLAADYSQIELRIIASLSDETTMIEAFNRGEDIHSSTASKVFKVPLEEVTRQQRDHAKTVNFGIIYGVSAFGLSNQTDLSRTEAKELIDTYYETYPKLKDYIQTQIAFAREHGWVETVLNRRRYLADINGRNAMVRGMAERNAVNAPVQGSAADIIKIAMIEIHKQLKERNLKTKMLLQVHDELVFDAYKPELEEIKTLITEIMEGAYKLSVPLKVDIGVGENWLEAH